MSEKSMSMRADNDGLTVKVNLFALTNYLDDFNTRRARLRLGRVHRVWNFYWSSFGAFALNLPAVIPSADHASEWRKTG